MTDDLQYTPDMDDIRIPYRFAQMGLMRDPNDKPFDAETMRNADSEFDRFIAKLRHDTAREVLTELIDDSYIDVAIGSLGLDEERIDKAEAVIDAAYIYRETEYPEENQ